MAEWKRLDNNKVSDNIRKKDDSEVSAVIRANSFKNLLVLIATAAAACVDVAAIGLLAFFGYELVSLVLLCVFAFIEIGIIVLRIVMRLDVGSRTVVLLYNGIFLLPLAAYLYAAFAAGLWGFIIVLLIRAAIQACIIVVGLRSVASDGKKRITGNLENVAITAIALLLCIVAPVYCALFSPATGVTGEVGRSAVYSVDRQTGEITLEYFLPGSGAPKIPETATVFVKGRFETGTVTTLGEKAFSNISDVESMELPKSVSKVDTRLFSSGSVKSLTVTSDSVTLLNEEQAASGELVLSGNEICEINYSQSVSTDIRFTVDRNSINSYRSKYVSIEDRFAPKLEDGELFVNYNNSDLRTDIVKKDKDGYVTVTDPSANMETSRITDGREQRFIWWRLSSEGNVEAATFPLRTDVSVNLYATWVPVYKITYALDDGEAKDTLTNEYYYSAGDVSLPDAEKDGYTFMGWYLTGASGNFTDKVTGISQNDTKDYSLSAKFLKNYMISYDWNGGAEDNSAPTYYHSEMEDVKLPSSSRRGYTFAGWKTSAGDEISSIDYGSEGDVALTAQWDIINYNITYVNPIKCENENASVYNVESDDIKLYGLDRIGYAFDGWYTNADFTEAAGDTAISAGSIGNKTFYAKWTLLPPTLISVRAYVADYDGQDHTILITADYPDNAMSVHYSWGKDGIKISENSSSVKVKNVKDSGAYTCTVWLTDGAFTSSKQSTDITVSIKKVTLHIAANDSTIIYGEAPIGAGVSYNGFVAYEDETYLGGTLSYSFDYNRFGDVGNGYTVTPKGLSSENYELDYQNGTLIVKPLAVSVTWINQTRFVYSGAPHSVSATVANRQNNDDISLSYTGNSGTAANGYDARITGITGAKNANYTLDGVTNLSRDWEIVNADITGSVSGYSAVFDGQSHNAVSNNTLAAVDGTALTVTYALSSTGSYSSAMPTVENAGTVTVYYKAVAANHNEKSGSFNASITAKEISIDWGTDDFTYNGSDQSAGVTATYKDVGNATVALSVSLDSEFKHYKLTGYTATVSFANGETNYKLPSSRSRVYHIKKKAAQVTANNASSTYYSQLAELTATDSGIVAGDSAYELQTTATATSIVGDYAITGRTINNDYDISYTSATYTITPAAISGVAVTGYNGTYDGSSHNADVSSAASTFGNQAVHFLYGTVEGTYNQNHITVTDVSDSKTYYYRAYANNHDDYFGSFTVNISTLDITGASIVLGGSLTYNGSEQTKSVTSVSKGGLPVTYSVTGDKGTNADDYTLTVQGTGNFSGTASIGWSIAPKEIEVLWCADSFVYNGADQSSSVTATYKDVRNADVALSVSLDGEFIHYKQNGYTATVGFANGETNYKLPLDTTKVYHVSKKTISVTIGDKTSVYGDDIVPLTAVDNGIISGDTNVYSLSTAVTSTSSVGTYDIVGHVGSNTDYAVTFTDTAGTANKGTYTVTSAAITGDVTGYSGDYDGNTHSAVLSDTLSGVLGATITVTYSSDGITYYSAVPEYTAAGTYTVYYKAFAANHTEKTGSFTVTINKISYDMSGVAWDYTEAFMYDGGVKTVKLSGLPDGVTPNYQDNSFTDAGEYTATVTFGYDTVNYTEPHFRSLAWEIQKAKASAPVIASKEYVGSVLVADVEDTSVYTVVMNNGGTDAGEYDVTLQLVDADNYCWESDADSDTLTVKFNITKASIATPTTDSFWYDDSIGQYVYVGDGTVVSCTDDGSGAGVHNVTVSLVDKDNYLWDNGSNDDITFEFTVPDESDEISE